MKLRDTLPDICEVDAFLVQKFHHNFLRLDIELLGTDSGEGIFFPDVLSMRISARAAVSGEFPAL
jgi:hypothetical protein